MIALGHDEDLTFQSSAPSVSQDSVIFVMDPTAETATPAADLELVHTVQRPVKNTAPGTTDASAELSDFLGDPLSKQKDFRGDLLQTSTEILQ